MHNLGNQKLDIKLKHMLVIQSNVCHDLNVNISCFLPGMFDTLVQTQKNLTCKTTIFQWIQQQKTMFQYVKGPYPKMRKRTTMTVLSFTMFTSHT